LSFLAPVILIVGAAAVWHFNHRSSGRPEKGESKAAIQMPLAPAAWRFEQLTEYGNVPAAAISPDGKQIVYVEENSGQQSLWIKQLATLVNVRIIPPGYYVYNHISFSHDGNYIYFTQHGQNEASGLYRVPILGGPPAKLVANTEDFF